MKVQDKKQEMSDCKKCKVPHRAEKLQDGLCSQCRTAGFVAP